MQTGSTTPSSGLTCDCGKVCKSKSGLTLHRKVCAPCTANNLDTLQGRLLEAQIRAINVETDLKRQEAERKAELEAREAEQKTESARHRAEMDRKEVELQNERLKFEREVALREISLKERCMEAQVKQSGECVEIYK